jgi:hypothetical protein
LKATIVGALIGLWFALIPMPTWAAALPSDQVLFSGSLGGQSSVPFTDSAESGQDFFQITLPAGVAAPTQTAFGMIEPPCGQAAGGCQDLSDMLSFTTSTSPDTGQETLSFSFQSDTESAITNPGSLTTCVEGSVGCGTGVFQIGSGGSLLSVNVTSDGDIPGVPEPSTALLLGPGLAGLAVWGRTTLKRI